MRKLTLSTITAMAVVLSVLATSGLCRTQTTGASSRDQGRCRWGRPAVAVPQASFGGQPGCLRLHFEAL